MNTSFLLYSTLILIFEVLSLLPFLYLKLFLYNPIRNFAVNYPRNYIFRFNRKYYLLWTKHSHFSLENKRFVHTAPINSPAPYPYTAPEKFCFRLNSTCESINFENDFNDLKKAILFLDEINFDDSTLEINNFKYKRDKDPNFKKYEFFMKQQLNHVFKNLNFGKYVFDFYFFIKFSQPDILYKNKPLCQSGSSFYKYEDVFPGAYYLSISIPVKFYKKIDRINSFKSTCTILINHITQLKNNSEIKFIYNNKILLTINKILVKPIKKTLIHGDKPKNTPLIRYEPENTPLIRYEPENTPLIRYEPENTSLILHAPENTNLNLASRASARSNKYKAGRDEKENIIYDHNVNELTPCNATLLSEENEKLIISKGKYGWNNYYSKNNYNVIGVKELRFELDIFFKYFEKNYPDYSFFAILFKIKFNNDDIRSCSTTQITTLKDFERLMSSLSKIFFVEKFMLIVSEAWKVLVETNVPAGHIIFTYKPLKTLKNTKYEELYVPNDKELDEDVKNNLNYFKYKNFFIPSTMDLWVWPNIHFSSNYDSAYSSIKIKNRDEEYVLDFIISIKEKSNYIIVKNKDVILFTMEDFLENPYDLTDFKRVIIENNIQKTYIFYNNDVKVCYHKIKTSFIEKIPKDLHLKPKILTLDFETRDLSTTNSEKDFNITARKIPICISVYDGHRNQKYSYIFKNINTWSEELAIFFKKNFMKRKFDYYKIYVHNLAKFDINFLVDPLSRVGEIKWIKRKDVTMKLTLIFKINEKDKRKCRIIFYDSNLIFQSSLRNLSASFAIKNPKDHFPFGFMNKHEVDFNYAGNVPKFEDFIGTISHKDYLEYCNRFKYKIWQFKTELIKYCENDTIALYQIMTKFHSEIYNMFKIDISKYPTLPSIAFAIYRANFMEEKTIPKILGKHHYKLKESYYGGITESYKPFGHDIRSYDINSLYPSSMHKFDMPVGEPIYFSGDISLINKKGLEDFTLGFYKVKVTAPLDLFSPSLPLKFAIKSNGHRTIFPVGEWTAWYFSEEINNKIQHGYKFEIIEGYLFKGENIFKDYISKLYEIKVNIKSDDPKYFIAKLLMNSLYGRFGLNPEETETKIVSADESEAIIVKEKKVDVTPLLSGKVIVTYIKDDEDLNIINISVPISSAIAAYSRNIMTHYLIKYSNNIYAIDTDGIKVNCDLDPYEKDNKKLGKMKYEYTFNEAVFPAPKVYGGLLKEPYKNSDKELVKIKGYKNSLPYNVLKTRINKHTDLVLKQEKWIRKINESTILVKWDDYTLGLNESKRELIFNPWGDLISTRPFKLLNNKIEKRGHDLKDLFLVNPILYFC